MHGLSDSCTGTTLGFRYGLPRQELRPRNPRSSSLLRTAASPTASALDRVLLPDRDVLGALAREGLALPARPSVAQPHPGQLRHEVELAGPGVAERDRSALEVAVGLEEVVRDQALPRDVVLVDPPVALIDAEDAVGVASSGPASPDERSRFSARSLPRSSSLPVSVGHP